jgi:hypothetical protein
MTSKYRHGKWNKKSVMYYGRTNYVKNIKLYKIFPSQQELAY